MSKKILFSSFLLLLLLALAFSGCSQPAEKAPGSTEGPGAPQEAAMEPVVLTLAHFFPASHPVNTVWVEGWIEAVEEATDGLIKIDNYPGETLMGSTEIYDGIVEGSIDIGLSCPEYNYGRFPVFEALVQPGIIYQSDKVASSVSSEFLKVVNPEEIHDTKVLAMLSTGPGVIWSIDPIHTLEDLQGKEVRVTGVHVPFIEALGAVPVAMPQSEAYEALQRGVVDANLGPLGMLKSTRQAEVANYIIMTPFIYNCLWYTAMNLEVWNSFPAEIQEKITEVTERLLDEVGIGLHDEDSAEGLRWSVEEQGMEVIHLSDEERERWIERLLPVQEEYIKRVEAMGLPGREIMDKVLELADKYDKMYH